MMFHRRKRKNLKKEESREREKERKGRGKLYSVEGRKHTGQGNQRCSTVHWTSGEAEVHTGPYPECYLLDRCELASFRAFLNVGDSRELMIIMT